MAGGNRISVLRMEEEQWTRADDGFPRVQYEHLRRACGQNIRACDIAYAAPQAYSWTRDTLFVQKCQRIARGLGSSIPIMDIAPVQIEVPPEQSPRERYISNLVSLASLDIDPTMQKSAIAKLKKEGLEADGKKLNE